METRPRIHLPLSTFDWLLEITGFAVVVSCITYCVLYYDYLPQTVPIHFNREGIPDKMGDKSAILLLLSAKVIMYIALTILSRMPHRFNFPVPIDSSNAEQQYRNSVLIIRLLKLLIAFMFSYLIYSVARISLGLQETLGNFLLVMLISVLLLIVLYFYQAKIFAKTRSSNE